MLCRHCKKPVTERHYHDEVDNNFYCGKCYDEMMVMARDVDKTITKVLTQLKDHLK